MSAASSSIELQHIRPGGNAQSISAEQTIPVPNPPPTVPVPASSVTSYTGNGNTQHNSQNPQNAGLPYWSRFREWWPELGGALLSILLLIAIIVFLAEVDGSKLDDWTLPWEIKPPTVVSILVTLCRITLAFFIAEGIGQLKWVYFEQRPHSISDFDRFDEATRGPWGATRFAWAINRRALVATFGAIMAILILAMDPFSQQVLFYAPRISNKTDDNATLPSTQFYDSGALFAAFSADNSTASFDPDPISSSTFASANSGLSAFGNGGLTSFGQRPTPTTGSSTIGGSPMPSLSAFGSSRTIKRQSSIIDASQWKSNCSDTLMARAAYAGLFSSVPELEFGCPSGNCTWPSFTTLGVCSECRNITSKVKRSCIQTLEYDICWYELIEAGDLPGGAPFPGTTYIPYLPGPDAVAIDHTKFVWRCTSVADVYWPLWFTWASNIWDKSRDLLSFTSYRFPKNNDPAWPFCSLPMAHIEQCTLFWCAKTFGATAVVNGTMNQGPSTDVRIVPFDAANTTCPGLKASKASERRLETPMQGLVREDRACPQSRDDIESNDIFWVNKNDHIMTVNMLSPIIQEREMAIDQNGATYDGKSSNAGSEAAIMTALWDNHEGNLSSTLADVATAMRNRVRSMDGYINVTGSSTKTDTVIKVTWYCLIYMVAMVGLSLAFFVTAVVFASEKSKVIWKSSSLAVLMHGLSGFDRSVLDHRSLQDMAKSAEGLLAQLETDDKGSLMLVRH